MKNPTPKSIDQFIVRLVRGKLEDGQLSDSPLSLRDIDEICEAFSDILKGVYHERIEYPIVSHYTTGSAEQEPVPETSGERTEENTPADKDGSPDGTGSEDSGTEPNENGAQQK